MKRNPILIGLCALFASTVNHAAALDQSGQSILAFLENGNYVEVSATAVDPDISGKIRNRPELVNDPQNLNSGNMGNSFQYYAAALKLQLTDRISFGLLYDQPFGADITYPMQSNNTFSDNEFTQQGTSVNVDTESISMIFGVSPFSNFQLYGGAVYQSVKGDVALRGNSYSEAFNGYDAKFKQDHAVGWLAGLSYQIPDIALKAAVTYRSKIDHDMQVTETMFGQPLEVTTPSKTKISTPQSVSLDFQTGVYKDTLAYANVRWVNWKDFHIRPTQFGAVTEYLTGLISEGTYTGGFDLDSYQKDQWMANVGIGHQFSEKWSASTEVSWDSGTGDPASTLNPTQGSWGLGIGVQFNPAPNYFIAGGIKYFWLGDVVAEDGTYYIPVAGIKPIAEQADFKDNSAIGYGLKIGYRF
ncbi:OmpP1/FadL family transporter [Acinetobacter vivianii]|uniref:OmpP1/FadL family transporter n=1 Tax=Acinetobacter vivianii TaxID=1776742 RepID=UPI002DBFAE8A|nr:outer membrane protein transport protein [Acinetobacter vivianii]MEB6478257.1 outer membrane protein transport protein [Acinetobacter vivianii]MEB6657912.1 outer membrane protein transport protein [Acinetobacter vivianii]